MQKKLIALAVAGLVSGGAFAQSNVTIYGIVDIGFESGNAGQGSKFRIQSGQSAGSRLGFKGEEALGGGNTAMFQLETGFVLDNGNLSNNSSHLGGTSGGGGFGVNTGSAGGVTQGTGAGLFQRTAIAGVKGSWGQVTAGRQYAPEFLVTAAVDPFKAGLAGNNGIVLAGMPAFAQRLDNSVMYTSPNMSGFTLGIGYSSGFENNVSGAAGAAAADTTDKAGKAWALLGTYANGPAYVGLAYHNVNGATFNSTAGVGQTDLAKAKSWLGGASWDFKVVKLSGTYASGNTDQPGNGPGASGKIVDARAYTIGLTAPMGPWTFNAVIGKKNDKTVADKDFSMWSLGGEYALSKRTAFYGSWTKCNNNDNHTTLASTCVLNSALNTGLQQVVSGGKFTYDPSALQMGMRHSF